MTTAPTPGADEPTVACAPVDGCGAADGTGAPLVALFSHAEAAFVAEFDAALRESEFPALSFAHSRNVLRHLHGGPRRASQLATDCALTKQAISQQVAQLEKGGFVTTEPDPADQRARLVALTPLGERAQTFVHALFRQIEASWAADLGAEDLEQLRTLLTRLVQARGGRASSC